MSDHHRASYDCNAHWSARLRRTPSECHTSRKVHLTMRIQRGRGRPRPGVMPRKGRSARVYPRRLTDGFKRFMRPPLEGHFYRRRVPKERFTSTEGTIRRIQVTAGTGQRRVNPTIDRDLGNEGFYRRGRERQRLTGLNTQGEGKGEAPAD